MTEQAKNPKMRVKLGQQNELKFLLSIKGSTSDPKASKPIIRFLITEANTGVAVCLPMQRLTEGTVGVTIPNLQELFQENTEYTGQVEVIVGNRWFNPTTIGLVFEKEMEVEAAPIVEAKTTVEELAPSKNDEFLTVIKQSEPIKKKVNMDVNDGAVLDILFSEPKPILNKEPPKPVAKTITSPAVTQIKKKLKSLISEAWNDLTTTQGE